MSQSSFRVAFLVGFGVALSPLALPALAQDSPEIVVHGHSVQRADPNQRITRNVTVSVADLNLQSDADVEMLRQRIREAADSACDAVKREIPTMNADAYNDCVQEARTEAMNEVRRAIGRARG